MPERDGNPRNDDIRLADVISEQRPTPETLDPRTAVLIESFAEALRDKLLRSQIKYGYGASWMDSDWMDECRVKLMEHLKKGDPRDVAAYCAFLWHHGASTEGCLNGEAWDKMMSSMVSDSDRHLELLKKTLAERDEARAHRDDRIQPVMAEIRRAMEKFPTWPTDPLHAIAVLGEEFGELTKEALQLTYEPHKSTVEDFRKEAIQCAAMALRFVMSLGSYAFTPGVQHSQPLARIGKEDA